MAYRRRELRLVALLVADRTDADAVACRDRVLGPLAPWRRRSHRHTRGVDLDLGP